MVEAFKCPLRLYAHMVRRQRAVLQAFGNLHIVTGPSSEGESSGRYSTTDGTQAKCRKNSASQAGSAIQVHGLGAKSR